MGHQDAPTLPRETPELLRAYGLNASAQVSLLRSATNDVYLVQDRARSFILKLYDPAWRCEAEIRWEIALIDHLVAHGAPVAAVLARRDGQQLTRLPGQNGTYHAVLYEHAPGHKPRQARRSWTPRLYRSFGHATAQLHLASQSFVGPPQRRPRDLAFLLDAPTEQILQHLPDAADRSFLRGFAARCRRGVLAAATGRAPHLDTVTTVTDRE